MTARKPLAPRVFVCRQGLEPRSPAYQEDVITTTLQEKLHLKWVTRQGEFDFKYD